VKEVNFVARLLRIHLEGALARIEDACRVYDEYGDQVPPVVLTDLIRAKNEIKSALAALLPAPASPSETDV
jgi:hypothetical protein